MMLLAGLAMLVDHLNWIVLNFSPYLFLVGRVAMPLFAVGVARGVLMTSDRVRYASRLWCCAAAAEVPHTLAFADIGYSLFDPGNIVWTFAVVATVAAARAWSVRLLLAVCSVPLIMHVEYSGGAVLLMAAAWLAWAHRWRLCVVALLAGSWWSAPALSPWVVVLAAWLLGVSSLLSDPRWVRRYRVMYWFYPGHLAVLALVAYSSW